MASDIADGMAARGLDVTLFATGNSQSRAHVSSVVPVGLNEDPGLDGDVYGALHTAALFERAAEFDLIHNNFDWKPLTYALATQAPPMLTTIHGFSRPPILAAYYAAAKRSFYCSISDSDRDPGLGYVATTYNGVDPAAFTFSATPGDYLVFLGRFHEEKGAHLAIEIAKRAGVRLKMAAIHQDMDYFRSRIAPHIDGDRVQFLGAVGRAARDELLRGALALVHMTTRPERFGLVLVEAMACGTPVVASAASCLPEIGGGAPVYADPRDAGAWAQALRSVVEDGELRARMRQAGLGRASRFDWDSSAERHVAVFRDAAAAAR